MVGVTKYEFFALIANAYYVAYFFNYFRSLQSYLLDMLYSNKFKGFLGCFLMISNKITVILCKYEFFLSLSLLNVVTDFYLLYH